MFGQALRLLAVGEAGQRLGGYVKKLVTKYLVLSVAGMAFLGAIVFAILAGFWALSSSNHDPIISAGIMAAILALVGGLIALTAYGITREKPQQGVSQVTSGSAKPGSLCGRRRAADRTCRPAIWGGASGDGGRSRRAYRGPSGKTVPPELAPCFPSVRTRHFARPQTCTAGHTLLIQHHAPLTRVSPTARAWAASMCAAS